MIPKLDSTKNYTYGELYNNIGDVTTREEAKAYLNVLVDYAMIHFNLTKEKALEMELHNIGYVSGYYDQDTHNKILELFDTTHPIFGKSIPTPEEAMRKGKELGRKMVENEKSN